VGFSPCQLFAATKAAPRDVWARVVRRFSAAWGPQKFTEPGFSPASPLPPAEAGSEWKVTRDADLKVRTTRTLREARFFSEGKGSRSFDCVRALRVLTSLRMTNPNC
jgi:hypothetical protein